MAGRGRGTGERLPPPPASGIGPGRGRARATGPPRPLGPPPGGRGPPPTIPRATQPGFYTSSRIGSSESGSSPSAPPPGAGVAAAGKLLQETKISEPSLESSTSLGSKTEIPPTYYRGQNGKMIPLTSNYLKLIIDEEMGVFEYEVTFEPRVDNRDQRFRLLNQHRETIGGVKVFDGVKLYLPRRLDDDKKLPSVNSENGDKHDVMIKFKRQKKAGDRDVVQLYNVLFGRIMRTLKFTQHNRKYYNAAGAHQIKEYNLSVWPGYVTAVDQMEGGLLLQLDVSHRVLRTETVRDLLVNLRRKGFTDIKTEAEKQLLGASVLTRYNNKSYKVDDIDFDSSPKDTFTNEKGEEMSYIDYYKRQYSLEIRDPDQPMLIHRLKKRSPGEKDIEKLICLVPELCLLTGMTDAMRADFRIMKEVATYTRVNPLQRQQGILKFIKAVQDNELASKHLLDWGLHIATHTLPLEGRQLRPETIFFGKGKQITVNPKADWGRDATNNPVLTPVALGRWAILFVNKNEAVVKDFCKNMQQQGPKMGIPVANPKVVSLPNDRTETYLKAMRELISPTVQLLLAVVPAQKSDRYAAIKKLCCIEKPIASQVVCLKTISNPKKLASVVQKIALQINCKLGGELWACQTPFKDLMVVGIDVYHEKRQKSGSIAGVVASLNDNLSRYYSTVAIQREGQEIIDALKVAFMEALIQYYETNNKWPTNIVIFRDGVSDSQMDIVEKHEAEQFLRTFSHIGRSSMSESSDRGSLSSHESLKKKLSTNLPRDYQPGFTFIIVQKRITTRIFWSKGPNNFENPPAGTVLDHTITRFKFKDFFLIPQSVGQGTVSPTHFVVIKESPTLPPDAIQRLAYKLTHMYYNWPGTVRVPAPCQYAHKLVDLVGENLRSQPSPELNHKLYYL